MRGLVTVAIPVYKRLHYLPGALRAIRAQDYPDIELLVSDNGDLGGQLDAIVRQHYNRPFRIRRAGGVPLVEHFNSLLDHARGEYFVLLCDDDEISPDFVRDLVSALERHPGAAVALPIPETMDANGGNLRRYQGQWPEVMRGPDFVRAWASKQVRLMSTVTHMCRTKAARESGYPDLPRALYSDNVLVLRMALRGEVAFARSAVFRWRVDDASTGFSASWREVAAACQGFLRLLERDPSIRAFAAREPREWPALRAALLEQCASWYYFRWVERYGNRLSATEWVRAAIALPYIPSYYRRVAATLRDEALESVRDRLRKFLRPFSSLSSAR